MTRLKKLIEYGAYGKQTGRVAYVLKPSTLPNPKSGFEWAEDPSFNAAEAVLADPELKEAFSEAIRNGHAIVVSP